MKKSLAMLLITSFIFVMSNVGLNPVAAESITDLEKKIEQLEKQNEEMQTKQGDIHNESIETDNKMKQNKAEQLTLEEKIAVLNQEIDQTKTLIETKELEIKETDDEIAALVTVIEVLNEEITALEERIEQREILIKERLRSMQKTGGNVGFLEVVLGAKSFSEFISRSSAVTTIVDQDNSIIEAQTADKLSLVDKQQEIQQQKNNIEAKRAALEAQKEDMLTLKAQLDDQAEALDILLAELALEYEALEDYKIGLKEEEQVLADQVKALKKAKKLAEKDKAKLQQLAREKAASRNNHLIGNRDGIFSWPVTGRISSHFGWRTHPIFGDRRLHAGTDFAVGIGTPLRAPAAGVVSLASSFGGYGNAIMITHVINGVTYTTVHAHLNSIAVRTGQVVSEGQVIGATGNTGNSTGPHLHFEVHLGSWSSSNANAVNPMLYLK